MLLLFAVVVSISAGLLAYNNHKAAADERRSSSAEEFSCASQCPSCSNTTLREDTIARREDGSAGRDLISVSCWLTNLDITYYTGTLNCLVEFWGVWSGPYNTWQLPRNLRGMAAGNNSTTAVEAGASLVLDINGQASVFAPGDTGISKQLTFGLGDVDRDARPPEVAGYPFIRLPFAFRLQAYLRQRGEPGNVYILPQVPVMLRLSYGYLSMYHIERLQCLGRMPDHAVGIKGVVHIDKLTLRMVANVLNPAMWIMAVTVLCASIVWLFIRHENAFIGLESVAASLLFALPTMRDLLPVAPQSGTRHDFVNIYAQLVLVGTAVFLALFKGIFVLVFQRSAYQGELGQFYVPYFCRNAPASGEQKQQPAGCGCWMKGQQAAAAAVSGLAGTAAAAPDGNARAGAVEPPEPAVVVAR